MSDWREESIRWAGTRSAIVRAARKTTKQRAMECVIDTYAADYGRLALSRRNEVWESRARALYCERYGIGIIGLFVLGAIIQWLVMALLDRLVDQPGFGNELIEARSE